MKRNDIIIERQGTAVNKKTVQIIGHPGTGKTTLMVDLVRELTKNHIRVGTIK
ncbi:MAG: molybdopterin-guanine dinucleotide biosynthesis protein B, partial [Desulfobacteraceae bacterium]|nr:molybdopterin-guanine dinucleotide biosynthesis protein B [Desulfobacteraceae bacterium]